MSTAGIFILIADDGKADKLIMATQLLKERLDAVSCERARMRYSDPTPTLVDIEQTHILFMNAHFKPFAAIGYQYDKINLQTGNPNFGESVQFSIPQSGDFFHDMVSHVLLGQVQATAGTVPAYPTQIGTTAITAGTGIGYDTVTVPAGGAPSVTVHKFTYSYVNQDGTALAPGAAVTDFVRYAEYPGERLFKHVAFEVNSNPLDDYTSDAVVAYRKFCVGPHKITGWKRLVGQEVPKDCYSDLMNISGTTPFAGCASNFAETGLPTGVSSVVAANKDVTSRRLMTVVDGPQTPKAVQPALDIWIPLLFWFNRDVRLSISSVSIPYGQRFINIEIEQQKNIVYLAPGNLWLKLDVECFTMNNPGAATYAADPAGANTLITVDSYQKSTTMTPVRAVGCQLGTQTINRMELYINNIFVNPEIHDIYIKRIGFNLIRLHRQHRVEVSKQDGEELLSSLKWPVETLLFGFKPKYNTEDVNLNQWRDWHNFTRLLDKTSESVCKVQTPYVKGFEAAAGPTLAITAGGGINNDLITGAVLTLTPDDFGSSQSTTTCERSVYTNRVKTVDKLSLNIHGISLYPDFSSDFFSNYVPWQYGGTNINTPDDEGMFMINFCLYPGTYQPSGHINISRTREFHIKYTSSFISATDPDPAVGTVAHAVLIIIATALNFLLISDGSAVLRYST